VFDDEIDALRTTPSLISWYRKLCRLIHVESRMLKVNFVSPSGTGWSRILTSRSLGCLFGPENLHISGSSARCSPVDPTH
jgi:hypothetical protein